MPVPTDEQLGPLARLAGTWEGDEGLDVAYSHARACIGETQFRERTVFNPFGPVDNGTQCLFGLDYRMAAWRAGEDDPFHTEIGYWLWDAADLQVTRCFVVPRGSMILAGGSSTPDATSFTMTAELGSPTYGILSNPYLDQQAKTVQYTVTVTANDDGTLAYESTTTIDHKHCDEILLHTDRNRLHRVPQ